MATWTKILTEEAIATSSSLGNSNTVVPSQGAVKSYVDGKTDNINDGAVRKIRKRDFRTYYRVS